VIGMCDCCCGLFDMTNDGQCPCGGRTAFDSSIDWETPEDAARLLASDMAAKPKDDTGARRAEFAELKITINGADVPLVGISADELNWSNSK
jgi:hypothetical protein